MSRVYLLRGIGGRLFSSGIDTMSEQLRGRGIAAYVGGHSDYQTVIESIARRDAWETSQVRPQHEPVVMIGHSQGANNLILSAIELEKRGIAVDLLVTLCPVGKWYFPTNVHRAMNFYTGTWGNYVPAADPTQTLLQSVDYSGHWGIWHLNISNRWELQQMVLAAVDQALGRVGASA